MRSYLNFICALVFFLITVLPVHATDMSDNVSKDDTRMYHVFDDVDLVSTLKFAYGKPRIVIKSVFPQLQTPSVHEGVDNFNLLVGNIVQEEIDGFKLQVAHSKTTNNSKIKNNNLFIDYATSVVQVNKHHIASIRFSMQGYLDGTARPYHYHRVLNYDLENEQTLELKDLFLPYSNYLEILSEYTQRVLFRRLKNQQMILMGTAPNEENFRNWNIKPSGLLFTFDQYQVAPYIEGAQTVLVPFSVLKKILAHDSAIAGCVFKKKCNRNNLLTGGFIDEAVNSKHSAFNPIFSKA